MNQSRACIFLLPLLAACSQSTVPTQIPENQIQPSPQVQAARDICQKEFAVSCDKLPHLLGPINAQERGVSEACLNNSIHDYTDGKWTVRPGNIYCLAVTI